MAKEEIKKTKKEKKEKTKEVKKSALSKLKGIIKKEEITPVRPIASTEIEPYKILKFVLMTEKAIRMIELQNKLVFIVDRKSTKKSIKSAAETAFQTSIMSVRTAIDQKGRKKAFIKFHEEGRAGEIAIRLGII